MTDKAKIEQLKKELRETKERLRCTEAELDKIKNRVSFLLENDETLAEESFKMLFKYLVGLCIIKRPLDVHVVCCYGKQDPDGVNIEWESSLPPLPTSDFMVDAGRALAMDKLREVENREWPGQEPNDLKEGL